MRKVNGGRVALQVTSGYYGLFSARDNHPSIALDDDDEDISKCWLMPALPSQLGVRLAHVIRPSFVSVEHLPPDLGGRPEQALRNATLWGVVDGKSNAELYEVIVAGHALPDHRAPTISKGLQWALLTSFVYDIHNPNSCQNFTIPPQYTDAGMTFGVFALEVHSNWGDPTTCLYRVGIYGTLV